MGRTVSKVVTTTLPTGSNRKAPQAAFTLIELSIAIFIMAMILAIAVPQFVRSYNASLLNAMGRSFATTCQYARVEAVLRQQKSILHIDLDRQTFWVTQLMRAPDAVELNEQVLKVVELPRQVALVSAETADVAARQRGGVEATFYPNGTCDAVTVVFRGSEKGSALAVEVDPVTARASAYPVKL
jgi:prepilin-type N-terminal cleavage/methylation domain-containing protein